MTTDNTPTKPRRTAYQCPKCSTVFATKESIQPYCRHCGETATAIPVAIMPLSPSGVLSPVKPPMEVTQKRDFPSAYLWTIVTLCILTYFTTEAEGSAAARPYAAASLLALAFFADRFRGWYRGWRR